MRTDIYDLAAYDRFAGALRDLEKRRNIRSMTLEEIEPLAAQTAFHTKNGSLVWRSCVSSRIAPRTVYLGPEKVRLPNPTPLQESIIEGAPRTFEKVLHLLETLPFIHLRRRMGDNEKFNPDCNLFVSTADPKNARLAYMWGNTMASPSRKRPGPRFTLIHIPEEHHMDQKVLMLPDHGITVVLGSDYMGEDKKGFLRQAMYTAGGMGMLGLHAGSKVVTAKDAATGRLKRWGCLIFGLTATGKSTWSCHQLHMDYAAGERTEVAQDDIVFLSPDGSALGSESGFYVKTDVVPEQQEAMYHALSHRSALLENVMVNHKGELLFLDESLCKNGRGIVRRDQLKIKRGHRRICISAKTINLPSLEELDGLMFAFITRRHTIMSFAQELTPEEAVLAYLWGESTHSYASNPAKAGESVRIVGTDPFIVGSRAAKVNQFHDIVMGLVSRYPGKVKFMQYNTGGMGEIIETVQEGGKTIKRVVRKVERVPLELMAAIQRGDFRGTNRYAPGILGTRSIVSCEGGDLSHWDPRNFYSEEQIRAYIEDLVEGRRKFTEEVAREGLKPEIVEAAERSFAIAAGKRSFTGYTAPASTSSPGTEEPLREPLKRPSRRPGWRYL